MNQPDEDVYPLKVAEAHDPVRWITIGEDEPETMVKVARVLRVVNEGKGAARLYIDGVMFGYATHDGFDVHTGSRRHQAMMPAVTLTIVAHRVEVVDDIWTQTQPVQPVHLASLSTAQCPSCGQHVTGAFSAGQQWPKHKLPQPGPDGQYDCPWPTMHGAVIMGGHFVKQP